MTRYLIVAVLCAAGFTTPVAAQEKRDIVLDGTTKEFVLDRTTGSVSQKDKEQDKEIAELKAKVARLEGKATPPEKVAAGDPFYVPEVKAAAEGCPNCGSYACPVNGGTARTGQCPCVSGVQKAGGPIVNPNWTPGAAVPQQMPAYRAAAGHTHTCPKCGTSWDHSVTPGHNCPNCGTYQNVQDSRPRPVAVTGYTPAPAVQYQIAAPATSGYTIGSGGGCANGSCASSSSQRTGLFGRLRR